MRLEIAEHSLESDTAVIFDGLILRGGKIVVNEDPGKQRAEDEARRPAPTWGGHKAGAGGPRSRYVACRIRVLASNPARCDHFHKGCQLRADLRDVRVEGVLRVTVVVASGANCHTWSAGTVKPSGNDSSPRS